MSGLPFELQLALRYLRPKRTFVSIITLISISGVALGVAVLIVVISVMSGFDQQMRDTIFGFNAHLRVSQMGQTMTNYPAVLSTIASNSNVRGVAPLVMGPVYMESEPATGQPLTGVPMIRGIDPKWETNVTKLPSSIVRGHFDLSGHGLLIGTSFADNMNLSIGDHVSILAPRDIKKMRPGRGQGQDQQDKAVLPDDYEVRGIFDVGYYEFNQSVAVVSLENAQDMYDVDDSVTSIIVMLHDPFQADTAQAQIESALGPDFEVKTWMQESPLLAQVVVEKNTMLYILFFIVLVAAFGITCTLITFIVMKTREIGLIKAVGASNRQVMWVFLGQSFIVSIFGIVAGFALGLLAVFYRNGFLHLMTRWTHRELFPQSIYGFSELPAKIIPSDLAIICGGSLLICLLAAGFPAWYASRLNPVEALRYE
jgi:lipoprotein-releasing system permease protein